MTEPGAPPAGESDAADGSAGPLSGVRVLDLASVVSGPMATVVLADQGADVIKVEPPGWGDGIRNLGASRNGLSAIFAQINRNKRSVAINLRDPRGADLVRQLVPGVDVVLQNYRPGRMDRIGLGFEHLREINPNLIYASISGLGEVGPYAEQKVYDYVIQGLSGVVDAQTTRQTPQMVRTIIYDKVTALTAAQGITAALFARERGGGGQHVRLSMLDAAIWFNWPDLMWNHSFVGEDVEYSGDLADVYEISRTSDGHVVSHHLGADLSEMTSEEVVTLLAANDIPVARANSRADVLQDPQVLASELLLELNHPRGGAMVQPRTPLRFGATTHAPHAPSPELGEHTVEILGELGLTLADMQDLARDYVIG